MQAISINFCHIVTKHPKLVARTTSIYYAFWLAQQWSAGLCAEPESKLQVCFELLLTFSFLLG